MPSKFSLSPFRIHLDVEFEFFAGFDLEVFDDDGDEMEFGDADVAGSDGNIIHKAVAFGVGEVAEVGVEDADFGIAL